jgi:hypothetical protein
MTTTGVYESRAVLKARIEELERQLKAVGLALIAVNDELKRLKEERKDASPGD